MTDTVPPRPAPIPPPDRFQIERLNALHDFVAPAARGGWRSRLADRLRAFLARILFRQREFNAALVDHINRNLIVGIQAHEASDQSIRWVQERIQDLLEQLESQSDAIQRHAHAIEGQTAAIEGQTAAIERHRQALAAWELRSRGVVASLTASHEELRTSIGILQQATHSLKRDVARFAEPSLPLPAARSAPQGTSPAAQPESLDGYTYVAFEDQFRGSSADIRQRVAEYLPVFQGTQHVLDVGCGRGEFLSLLREHGVDALGVDINGAMVDVCRRQGLQAEEADALAYLKSLPDGSLGGLFAAQVIEHLEPRYLSALLDAAFDKLRPGAPIVLETINPACWFAFFESYIRDITHVRAVHPETLKYLMVAAGFQRVDIQYGSPYPEHEKLQPLAPHVSLGDAVDTLNANVERINRLLFTWLDYAAVGRRP